MLPIAYLITFRSYGTWLPGDHRGYVDRRRNTPGHPMRRPNERLRIACASLMKQSVQGLDERGRVVVEAVVRQCCARETWVLHALYVGSNHVHVVVSAGVPPERIMGALKSWATRRLREEGLVGHETRPWSRHGSTRWLWNEHALADACRYVMTGQSAS